MLRLLKSLIIALIMIFSLGCTTAWAAEDQYYVRLGGSSTSLAGDFNGVGYALLGEETEPLFYIPQLVDGDGFEFAVGAYRGHLGGEISYLTNSHYSATHGGLIADSTFKKINFNVKIYLYDYEDAHFNVYGLLGVGFPRVKVDYETVPDITFKGIGYNAGAGFLFRFTDNLALEATYIYGKLDLSKVDYTGGSYEFKTKFESHEDTITVGLNYYF